MELKSCPFCATKDIEARHSVGKNVKTHIVCLNCKMRGPIFDDHALAVLGWNALPREGGGNDLQDPT